MSNGYHGKDQLPPTLSEKYIAEAVGELVMASITRREDDAQRIVETVDRVHGTEGTYWLLMGMAEVASTWSGMKDTVARNREKDPGGYMGLVVRRGTGCCPDHSEQFEDVNPEDLTEPFERDQAMMMRFLIGYVHGEDATCRGVFNAYQEDDNLGLLNAMCILVATYGQKIMGDLHLQTKVQEMFPGFAVEMPELGEQIWRKLNE